MQPSVIGLFIALVLLGNGAYADLEHSPILPDPKMTPGDVLTTDAKVICVPGYTKTVRNVPLKNYDSSEDFLYRRICTP
jgi:hypothetical protein